MRYNVKDITIFFHLLKNVNGIGGGFKENRIFQHHFLKTF